MRNDKAESYQANASKCVRLARNASDIHSKLTFLEMARAWLLLADRALKNGKTCLEPISKSFEEDHEAGELDEAEEVLAVVFPADEDAALPLDPGEEAFDEPTSHVTA